MVAHWWVVVYEVVGQYIFVKMILITLRQQSQFDLNCKFFSCSLQLLQSSNFWSIHKVMQHTRLRIKLICMYYYYALEFAAPIILGGVPLNNCDLNYTIFKVILSTHSAFCSNHYVQDRRHIKVIITRISYSLQLYIKIDISTNCQKTIFNYSSAVGHRLAKFVDSDIRRDRSAFPYFVSVFSN